MRIAGVLLLVVASATVQASPVYRCRDGGTVTYQEKPCAALGERIAIPETYPEVNHAERERLLQREAALEARLLKRAEIEAGERTARENRRARELELAAVRERTQPVEPAYFVPVFTRPLRPIRPHRHGPLLPRY